MTLIVIIEDNDLAWLVNQGPASLSQESQHKNDCVAADNLCTYTEVYIHAQAMSLNSLILLSSLVAPLHGMSN